jgi:succinate-acetate transporter protein
MKNFFKSLADYVFSFGTFWVLFVASFVFLLLTISEQEQINRKETQRITEACYAQGMVLVRTDAGQRCVLPQSLVKVK